MKRIIISILIIALISIIALYKMKSDSHTSVLSKMNELVSNGKTPGLQYMITNSDQIIFEYTAGMANVGMEQKMQFNQTFNAFSTTKTFTAMAIMQLHESGKLNIDDNASVYLKNFPYQHPFTVRQLLAHQAGLPNPVPLSWIHLAANHASFNEEAFVNKVLDVHSYLRFKPGKKFHYSNIGYLLLGRVIENVSCTDYQTYISKNILRPAGIDETQVGFQVIDTSMHIRGYHPRYSISSLILPVFLDMKKFTLIPEGKWKPFRYFYMNGSSYGGLIGNIRGLGIYLREMLKNNPVLLKTGSRKLLLTEQTDANNRQTGMCLGWFKDSIDGTDYYYHPGGGGGYYCEIRIYPEVGLASAVMLNRTGMGYQNLLDKLDRNFLP